MRFYSSVLATAMYWPALRWSTVEMAFSLVKASQYISKLGDFTESVNQTLKSRRTCSSIMLWLFDCLLCTEVSFIMTSVDYRKHQTDHWALQARAHYLAQRLTQIKWSKVIEWQPCAYVIVYGKLPPCQSFCEYCWVASQNGFHWALDSIMWCTRPPLVVSPQ